MRLSDNNTSSGSACILGLFIGLYYVVPCQAHYMWLRSSDMWIWHFWIPIRQWWWATACWPAWYPWYRYIFSIWSPVNEVSRHIQFHQSLSSLSILITAVIYHLRLSPLVQCQRAYTITRGRLQYQLIFYNKCIWTGQSGQTPFRKCIPLFAYRPSVVCQTIIKTNILNDASTEFEYLISRAFFFCLIGSWSLRI